MTEDGELFAWLIVIVVIGLAFKGFTKGDTIKKSEGFINWWRI